MDYPLYQKAWKINLGEINEGYCWGAVIAHGETRSKAKSKLFKIADSEGMSISLTGEDVTFITLPVLRCEHSDLFLFEGEPRGMSHIKGTLNERKRIKGLDDIIDDTTIKYCYIMKRGSYYRPNHGGYTEYQTRAGVYSKEEAVSSAKYCADLSLKPIIIGEHNAILTEKIEDLQTRIILD